MLLINLEIPEEEKFLINVLFNDKKSIKNQINLKNIDYGSIVKLASSHLVLPALYINLKKKNILNHIPEKLTIYLKKIYELNKERNKILIKEIKEISKILNDNDIDHIFLKGSSHIIGELYDDIGERMIGDIDILTENNKLINSYKIFKKLRYNKIENDFFYKENKHLSRLSSKKKIFSIEFHKRLLDKKSIYGVEPSRLLKTKLTIQKISIINFQNQFLHNIYNYQINDYGNLKSSYSYRSFYDSYLLHKKKNIEIDNIVIDNYLNNYLMIAKQLKVPIYKNINFKGNRLNRIRFNFKKSNKTFYKIDNFIIKCYRRILWVPKQIRELFINRKYRKYVINKIINSNGLA